jgi:DNA repair protein SbcC/Rad50
VLNKILSRAPLHAHADPAQRVLGIAELLPESAELIQLLRADPVPEVRAAAARRCSDGAALLEGWQVDAEPQVRTAIVESLGRWLDGIDGERLRAAVEGIGDQALLVELALTAPHAPARLATAERVSEEDSLRRLADAAKDKDRGVARLARQRVEAIDRRAAQAQKADELLAQAEALVEQPGAIVMPAVELERRWKALDLRDDAERLARWEAAGAALQARFEREREQQRAKLAFDKRLGEWLAGHAATPAAEALPQLRTELEALRAQAQELSDAAALAKLAQAEQSIAQWERAAPALAAAEALVTEAEQLAADTGIDNAQLPLRWQALDLAVRTPDLTRRFEAAIMVIESRRLAQMRATQQEESAARHQLHTLLHEAEQALAAGQVQAARTAADQTRALKVAAGALPKPTIQRLSRVVQQLGELERWMSFGQHNARVQLCERAEALAGETHPPAQLAKEVQKLRAEWKALDEQHAGVPKALWERFDGACEKAYAPAARHFAELHAQRKQARKQRDEFIAAAAVRAQELLAAEPRDLRAIERWLREADHTWHGADLGSLEPDAWKKLDARLKQAVAPLREVLAQVRGEAKSGRLELIAEAEALVAKAQERDAPALARTLQARWTEHAKAHALAGRDERVLWERFRAACNAVFEARDSQRKEVDHRKHEQRRAFEELCGQAEALAQSAETDEARIRGNLRELQSRWKDAVTANPVPPALDSRFRAARTAVEGMLGARSRSKEAAVWQALLEKAHLCEELDAALMAESAAPPAPQSARSRWDELPALSEAWEKKMAARRDEALHAFADEDARFDHLDRIDDGVAVRRDALLELELALGIPSPADLGKERLAVQVKQLRSRFKSATRSAGDLSAILLEWCATPGTADARDRGRCEKIVEALQRRH